MWQLLIRSAFIVALCTFSAASLAVHMVILKAEKNPPADIDDSVRINAAIEQVNELGGGVVYLKNGKYHIGNPINILSNVTLRGNGNGTKLRLVDNAPSFSGRAGIIRFVNDNDDTRVENVGIEDLFIDGNRDNQNQNVGESEKKFGIYAEADHLTIRRVTAANCMGYGFDPHGAKNEVVPGGPETPSTYVTIENSVAFNNYLDGFTLDRLEHSVFRSNKAYNNDRHGVNIVSDTNDLLVINNIVRKNGANGIMVQNGSFDLEIVANRIHNNAEAGIMLRQSDDNLVEDNLITSNGYEAVRLRGSSNNVVTNNTAFNNSKLELNKYFEMRLEDYNGFASLNNEVASNEFVSKRSKGIVYEKDNSDYNEYYNNNYLAKASPFKLIGSNSIEYDNTEAIIE